MPHGVVIRLRHALDLIEQISCHFQDRSSADLRQDRQVQLGLERQLSRLGGVLEGARARDPALVVNMPLAPAVVEMGETIIRDYDTLDYDAIWTMTKRDLPVLAVQIESVIATYIESPIPGEGRGTLIPTVDSKRSDLVALCHEYGVTRLLVFGSAVNGAFNPEESDLDFAVEMTDYRPGVAKRFMGFIVAMEDLFPGFAVHISSIHEGSSDLFRNDVETTGVTIYTRNVAVV